jgi:hypothetical protein
VVTGKPKVNRERGHGDDAQKHFKHGFEIMHQDDSGWQKQHRRDEAISYRSHFIQIERSNISQQVAMSG